MENNANKRLVKTPKVTLLTFTAFPLETIYSVWQASKNDDELLTPDQVYSKVSAKEVQDVFHSVIKQRIPVGEHIDFTFMLEHISISWREQAVRHRIGVLPGPESIGADIYMDIVPDLAKSSFWSQSMRIRNQGRFFTDSDYRIPESILRHGDPNVLRAYVDLMERIQLTYNFLVASNIPMEDARDTMPLASQHRMSWKMNISSLQHIVGERGCFILQLGLWGPVIMGIVSELVNKVHPAFAELVCPPCIKDDCFSGCVYHEENRRRYEGLDQHPPCPLHFRHHRIPEQMGKQEDISKAHQIDTLHKYKVPMAYEMIDRAAEYAVFWQRNPWTGERLENE